MGYKNIVSIVVAFLMMVGVAGATVTSTTNHVSYTCSGSTGPFAFTFPVTPDSSALIVTKTDLNGIITTLTSLQYTGTPVNGSYLNGGSITLSAACTNGFTLSIWRNTPETQISSFTEGMPTLYKTFERALDKNVMMMQDQAGLIGRAPLLPVGSGLTNPAFPVPGYGLYIGWNSAGTALETKVAPTVTYAGEIGVHLSQYANFATAISTIGATATTLFIDTAGTVAVNATIPSTLAVKVVTGLGSLTVNNGVTLTINGPFDAGLYQVFNCVGTGVVAFGNGSVKEVYPEWWGSFPGLASDTSVAFNAAINAGLPVRLQAGIYLVNAIHTTGFPIIQGAGMAVTYIKSYSATGYAWTESQVSASWNTNLVMNDLSILGTGSRNGFVFGDPVTYITDINYAGRCVFNRVSFQGCVIGFNKPWGNIGNNFNRCLFAGNSYGYHSSESAAHPMNAHEDIFNECIFMTNTLAAVYSKGISSTGQLVFNQGVFQENQGFAIFADNYYVGYIPLRINNVWFEVNAQNASTTINGTAYTTRDIYLKDVDYALIDGSMLANVSRELVNSSLRETNCNYKNDTIVLDSTSTLIQDNVNTWGPAVYSGGIRQSVANTSGGFGASYGETWNIPPRTGIVGGYTRKGGDSYTGTVGVTTFPFGGTGAVNATCVADGVIYTTAAELTIPAGYTLADNGANGQAAYTNGKWYVWSIDVKLTTTQKPTTIQFQNGSDSLNRTFHQLLVKDKWVTIGGIVKVVGASSVYLPYIVNSSANPVTLRLSAVQAVEFTSKADAINYFNARLYSHL